MKFDMETEPLPRGRPKDWRKHAVTIACTAIICTLIIILCVRLENVTREESRRRYEPGFRGPDADGPTGQSRTPNSAGPLGMETFQNWTTSESIFVEGIIAGTGKGVVIIPLDSLEQRTISSGDTRGVAFNWQSRKVYWIQYKVGIKTADIDGTSAELVISGISCGPGYRELVLRSGVRGSNPGIRVCDSMGQKCATVVSGYNNVGNLIYDIALFPSKGLMFWSSPDDKKP